MPFSESLKLRVKQKSNWQCCICEARYVEIHHIIPQEEKGPDTEDNAAPLCPNCHSNYGSNPQKRKFIKEKRDDWYLKCKNRYDINPLLENMNKKLEEVATIKYLREFEESLTKKIKLQQTFKPNQFFQDLSSKVRKYIKQNKFEGAIGFIKNNISENFYWMGYCYGEQSKIAEMLNSFKECISISDRYKSEIERTKKFYWAQNFNKGVKYFTDANEEKDSQHEIDLRESAIKAFRDCILVYPEDTDTIRNLAFVYMRSGRNEEAIKPFKKLVKLNQELDGYRYLGEIYYSMGINSKSSFQTTGNIQDSLDAVESFTNAIDILEQGSKLYSTDDEISRLLNASYVENGRIDEALESTKLLVNKEPQNKTYRYNYGVLLLQINDFAAAEEQLKYALDIDPEYDNAIYNLAVNYVKWGTYLSKEEEDTENYTGAYKKKYEEAMPYLQSVVKNDPENVEIWELLGKVYSILEMQSEALEALRKADQFNTSD